MPVPAVSVPRPAALLLGWEVAGTLPALARPAALLHHLGYVDSWDAALDLPVGTYAARVAATYLETFGPEVDVLVGCAGCGEQLEATLDLRRIANEPPDSEGCTRATVSRGTLTVRSPTLRDLLAVGSASEDSGSAVTRSPSCSPVAWPSSSGWPSSSAS